MSRVLCGSYLGLLSLLEESLGASLLLGLLGGEVLGLRNLLNLGGVEAGHVDLVGSGDDVAGVDSSQGNAVDLEGTGDEQDTLVESLEKDDTLAAEAAGEQDQDGAGLESLSGGPRSDGLANLLISKRVSAALFVQSSELSRKGEKVCQVESVFFANWKRRAVLSL